MNESNLLLLADYLEALPEDYKHFHMAAYNKDGYDPSQITESHCGTAACAVGHAIYVDGLPEPNYDETWNDYSYRIFGVSDEEWCWCFGVDWRYIDNTPHGAAKRIRYMVDHGVPGDWYMQMYCKVKKCY